MIDHSGHAHPSTPAARALCRANGGTGDITKKPGSSRGKFSYDSETRELKTNTPKPSRRKVTAEEVGIKIPKTSQPRDSTPATQKSQKKSPSLTEEKVPVPNRSRQPEKGDTDFSLRRVSSTAQGINMGGRQVGVIQKEKAERQRRVGQVQQAADALESRYFVRLDPAQFEESDPYLFRDALGSSSFDQAKATLRNRLKKLTVKAPVI